ncbi:HAD-IA family hydrolase [Desulforhopalus vacuolatus]|uniref:HAD family hydrolase n=1 Tax=Desulforhopalus vacuolatus TaxID=40414 RepID=UPI0019657A26|nr:HAD-IA family hydrolase [Desulforhopalus vacuolatus]MBM9518407.1 HAD-IA family hydrolase [Desulforhopalus vacuolatus]
MLKLIVFDCDGVMFDSKKSTVHYYNDLLDLFGHPPMDPEEEVYSHMATVDGALTHIFRNYPQKKTEIKHAARGKLSYSDYLHYLSLEPDLYEFLELAQKKYKLAISTNRSDTMPSLLEKYDLGHYFSKVMTALNTKPKPAPDGLLEILQDLKCLPEEAVFIGDAETDRLQAKACSVNLVAFRNPALKAEWHVSSFMELLQLPPFQQATL